MIPQSSTSTQKAASGRPPVANKNLRTFQRADASPKQKSRRVAAPRRSTDGTCEKPPTDRINLARYTAAQHRTTPLVPTLAAAETVPLLFRQTVHLRTGLYTGDRSRLAGSRRASLSRVVASIATTSRAKGARSRAAAGTRRSAKFVLICGKIVSNGATRSLRTAVTCVMGTMSRNAAPLPTLYRGGLRKPSGLCPVLACCSLAFDETRKL
jgi:hypothetical protein